MTVTRYAQLLRRAAPLGARDASCLSNGDGPRIASRRDVRMRRRPPATDGEDADGGSSGGGVRWRRVRRSKRAKSVRTRKTRPAFPDSSSDVTKNAMPPWLASWHNGVP